VASLEGSAPTASGGVQVIDKGLKKDALGFVSSTVIGVASTAPGYSLAASLGIVAASVGLQSPAIMIVAFIPMLFIAAAYYYMNRADPDCGTTFSWVTRAMGPWAGWMGGWAIIVADVIVIEAGPGDKVVIPPGWAHATVNLGDEPMAFARRISARRARSRRL